MALNHMIDTDDNTIPARLRYFLIKRGFELMAIIAFSAIVVAALSLASWSVADPSLNHATGTMPQNWLGTAGAILADQLIQNLGLSSLPFLFIPLKWVMGLFTHQWPDNPKRQILSWLGATIAFGVFASCLSVPDSWQLASGFGGNLGDVLGGLFLSILAIGMKGFVAKFLVASLALASFLWLTSQALAIGTLPAMPARQHKKPIRTMETKSARSSKSGQTLLSSITRIFESFKRSKGAAKPARRQGQRNLSLDESSETEGDDVL
ncbi:MAG: DNA translocase FtsK 4TM domain-containing protein, partial [Alphaproteobacteria bacterium]|nr:DNA translocase FtsK 4TM domain-containing protein [Alphaproteobacteria bacterium]